jgi:ABC-type uncharacterized transport system substrate-binding protein
MRKTVTWFATLAAIINIGAITGQAQATQGKKALYINSYHEGYTWSDGIQKSIKDTLSPAGVEVKVFLMDTYKNKSAEHLAKVSQEAKKIIEDWKPDVVLVSDDPAMKGIYAPFYKDKELPFVFCGVNWDATAYGVPAKNITGMLEVCPIKELLAEMNKITTGKTIGFLASEGMTPQKDLENCSKLLGVKMESVLAKDFASWKQGFLDLQSKVDLLVIGPNAGVSDWNEAEGAKFVEQNAKIVSGSWHDYLNGLSLVAFNKRSDEQGIWAANAAIAILKGGAPASIPLVSNKSGELVVNTRIAKTLKANLTTEMLQSAKLIE